MHPNVGPYATPEGEFTDGNPFLPSAPASIVGSQWLNTVQRELLGVLEAAGITPELDEFDQLAQAVIVLAGIYGGGGGGGETIVGGNVGGGQGVYKDKVVGAPSTLRFRSLGSATGDGQVTLTLNGDLIEINAQGASGSQRGVIKLAGGYLGGTADAPDVRGLRNSDGTQLLMGDVADGTFVKRNGTTLEGATPPGGGDLSGPGAAVEADTLMLWNGTSGTSAKGGGPAASDVARVRRPTWFARTEVSYKVRPGGQGIFVSGPGKQIELSGRQQAADDGYGPAILLTPEAEAYSELAAPGAGFSNEGVAGFRFGEWDDVLGGWPGGFRVDFETPAAITNLRLWVGLWSRDPSNLSTPGAGHHCVALRFDTDAGDAGTGKWRTVTSGGGGVSTIAEADDSGDPGNPDTVTAATRYVVELFPVWAAGTITAWDFYVNGVFVGTSTTRLPLATAPLALCLRSVNLAAAAAREVTLRGVAYYYGA